MSFESSKVKAAQRQVDTLLVDDSSGNVRKDSELS